LASGAGLSQWWTSAKPTPVEAVPSDRC